jgi:predicted nuclease of predicted toxin-antitoxin system
MPFSILADENIPQAVVEALAQRGHDILSVSKLSPGIDDVRVLELATKGQRLLITFDKDFGEIVFRRGASAASGVVLFRFALLRPELMIERITKVLESRIDWTEYFSVVDQQHVRMIRLNPPTSREGR